MKRNKIGVILMITVLALAGVGITYAGFTDTVTIYGSVNTARVQFEDLEYTGTWVYKVWDCEDAPDNEIVVTHDPDYDPEIEYPGCQYELSSWAETYPADPGDETFDVEVDFHNLMPEIEYVADLHFKVGTIPVKLNKLEYNFQGDQELLDLVDSGHIYGTMFTDTGKIIEEDSQIHAYEEVTLELHITIPQNNDYQGKTGSFTCELGIVQWTDPCGNVPNPKGSIEVKKITDPCGGSDFQFTVTGPGTNEVFTLNDGGSNTIGNLDLGTYTVTETLLAGWDLTGIDISGDYQSDSTGVNSITFDLEEGHAVVTFTNEEKSQDCQEETAWGGDTVGEGNAWWYYFDISGCTEQTITAGQHHDAGTVTVSDCDNDEVTITITLTDGWELQDVEEPVKIEGYNSIPTSRPGPGGFTYKGDALTVNFDCYQYYAIHLDVQNCDD